jgi:hypothetical protein
MLSGAAAAACAAATLAATTTSWSMPIVSVQPKILTKRSSGDGGLEIYWIYGLFAAGGAGVAHRKSFGAQDGRCSSAQ